MLKGIRLRIYYAIFIALLARFTVQLSYTICMYYTVSVCCALNLNPVLFTVGCIYYIVPTALLLMV